MRIEKMATVAGSEDFVFFLSFSCFKILIFKKHDWF